MQPRIPTRRPLTSRELQCIDLASRGLNNRQIASTLYVSQDTVKTMNRRAFAKLGAHDRAHAVRLAFQHGYLTSDRVEVAS